MGLLALKQGLQDQFRPHRQNGQIEYESVHLGLVDAKVCDVRFIN